MGRKYHQVSDITYAGKPILYVTWMYVVYSEDTDVGPNAQIYFEP